MTKLEESDFYKKAHASLKRDREMEEERRRELDMKWRSRSPIDKLDSMSKEWIKRYLSCSGIVRDEYSNIVGTYKRLTPRQIRGVLYEVHGIQVSTKVVSSYKDLLISSGELLSDSQYEENKPSREEMAKIRKERIERIREIKASRKSHLTREELNQILERGKEGGKEGKEELEGLTQQRIKKLREDQERGISLTDEEETFLEENEEEEN